MGEVSFLCWVSHFSSAVSSLLLLGDSARYKALKPALNSEMLLQSRLSSFVES
jgi:hypothetical protein